MKWIALSILLLSLTPVNCVCPYDLTANVIKCMRPVQPNNQAGAGLLMLASALQMTPETCREDRLQQAYSCLQRLYTACANTKKDAKEIGLIPQPDRWRQGIDTLCQNLYYINSNKECEQKAAPVFIRCAATEVETFTNNIKQLQQYSDARYRSLGDQEKLATKADHYCLLIVKIQECLRAPYEQFCSKRMTVLLSSIMEFFKPPACSKPDANYNPDQQHIDPTPANTDTWHDSNRINDNNVNTFDNRGTRLGNGDFVRNEIVVTEIESDMRFENENDADGIIGEEEEEKQQHTGVAGRPGAVEGTVDSAKDAAPGQQGQAFLVASVTFILLVTNLYTSGTL